ncbi:H+-exporting ATPase [Spizellomyces sp. 'palustris']|nr:H+-exporting ATPase [Spizellomyces sp. 'palustris']
MSRPDPHITMDMDQVQNPSSRNYLSASGNGHPDHPPNYSSNPSTTIDIREDQHAPEDGNAHKMEPHPEDIEQLLKELEAEVTDKDHPGEPEDANEEDGHKAITVSEDLLRTDPKTGLTTEEADKRRRKFGPNQLAEHKENMVMKFLMFFSGPIQYVMIAAAALAGGLQHWVDLGVILGLLLLNAVVGFMQEYQAGNIVAQLKQQLALKATVVRNGQVADIEAVDIVPGDIVKVDEGTIIPADGRVLGEHCFLQVDQSALTGESLAIEKHHNDELYSSSAIKRGHGYMVVTAIGDHTYVGRTAGLASTTQTRGKFTEVLNSIGYILLLLVIFWILAIWIAGFFRSLGIVDLLTYALIITVIGVPVGLPAVVTTTLAVGAAYLAKRQAIVQRLSAIESLAGCEILCSDKTGTLTKNKLVLHEPFLMDGVDADTLVLVCALASSRSKKGLDAIDKTVMLSLLTHDRARQEIKRYKTLEFQPFDPVTKRIVAVVEDDEGNRITCVKGAPPAVLKFVEQDHAIDRKVLKEYNERVAEFASRGFRSLGAAWKKGDEQWEILGILCLFDPPRDDTARTVTEAKELGLKVKMLTGDAVGIAKETARQLQLGTNVYNTKRLVGGSLSGSELNDFVVAADGFAEVFPEHKYMVVDILQKRGFLVAMTGDGVNDAPSLKKADAGIAVEGASDAARTSADIVFLAPGLGTIIDAIKTSRQIFHRMYSYVVYRIALSLHLEIFLTTSLIILDQTINVQLVVFLAIFADIATLAIAYDRAPFSTEPVKWDLPKIWGLAIITGFLLAVGTWVLYGTLLINGKGIVQNYGGYQEILFLEVTLTENWLIFITRSNRTLWDTLPSWQLVGAVLVVDIIATLFAIFGWFSGVRTDIVTVVRVWLYSLGVMAIISLIYYGLANSKIFSNLVRGRINRRQKNREDWLYTLERVSRMHEQSSWKHQPSRRRRQNDDLSDVEEEDDDSGSTADDIGLPPPRNARRRPLTWKDDDSGNHLATRQLRTRKLSVDPDMTDSEDESAEAAIKKLL